MHLTINTSLIDTIDFLIYDFQFPILVLHCCSLCGSRAHVAERKIRNRKVLVRDDCGEREIFIVKCKIKNQKLEIGVKGEGVSSWNQKKKKFILHSFNPRVTPYISIGGYFFRYPLVCDPAYVTWFYFQPSMIPYPKQATVLLHYP